MLRLPGARSPARNERPAAEHSQQSVSWRPANKPRESTMSKKETPRARDRSKETTQVSKRTTIPASEVGVTLTISDKALKEIDRIQEENIKAAQEGQKFSWR